MKIGEYDYEENCILLTCTGSARHPHGLQREERQFEQKHVDERLTGFGQTMIRNGGRNGVALSFGFRWAIGK